MAHSVSIGLESLTDLANELYCRGMEEDALSLFEIALDLCRNPRKTQMNEVLYEKLQLGQEKLKGINGTDCVLSRPDPPDRYDEDECDMGPRPFWLPIFPGSFSGKAGMAYAEMSLTYNRGLLHHLHSEHEAAMKHYEAVALALSNTLNLHEGRPEDDLLHNQLLELIMRVKNNMACISYSQGLENSAIYHFKTGLVFANRLLSLKRSHCNDLQLNYAVLLSNWCRVNWMSGDISEEVHRGLEDILRIRSSILGWNHMDTATAHFNLGVAEYARNRTDAAVEHLFAYLHVAAQEGKDANERKKLDPIPALIFILLVKNEQKDDEISQELVRGLRFLQEKRNDAGPHCAEVASVLNFVGTICFHQQDYEHALLFFQEELRLEEKLVLNEDDVSISVTCNNIGRILQELNRLAEAKLYYYRALEQHYGTRIEEWCSRPKRSNVCLPDFNEKKIYSLPHTTMQLYSAVWYNLGLIHDKIGSYDEAANAFQVSLGLRQKMLGPNHGDCACLLYNIGVLQMEQQMLKDAAASFREALQIRRVAPFAGHLNDSHVVQTLKKLASLHKTEGDVHGALETYYEILNIQENSNEFQQSLSKRKEIGTTMREIAELYHAQGKLIMAAEMVQESINLLRDVQLNVTGTVDFVATTEELVSGLLLLGSFNHENCDPVEACIFYNEASAMIRHVSTFFSTSTELDAMHEVVQILAACHCAPMA